jgi:GTPase SAR1 family protein
MNNNTELVKQAEALTQDQRKEILMGIPENDLHFDLKELFVAMEPSYTVEVTQGTKELGKDLVLVRMDALTTDVIGVVVKCGNIKGKTLGEVDDVLDRVNLALSQKADRKTREIESQIRQAFAHKAELTDFFQTLPVNKVIVIVAGEISKEARTRLGKEIHGPTEVHGINWLITNFSQHYPHVFFEGKVTNFIQRKIQELETRHRVIRSNRILSDSFVEPVVRATDISIDFGEELRAAISRKQLPFSKLKSVLSGKKKIILIGDPGTGKSAALAKLTIDLLKEVYLKAAKSRANSVKTSVPILVGAREFASLDTVKTLLDYTLGGPEVVENLEVRALLLDGLDEVVSSKRVGVIERAEKFADHLNCSLLIASRKIDLLSITPTGFQKFELLPFGTGQALQLIEKVQNNPLAVGNIRDGLDKMRYQIPMVPLSLILLIEIVEEHKEVPASVTELYERYSDTVLGRYDRDKGIEVLFEYLIKKRFLAELAYSEFYSKGSIEINREEFDAFCQRYAEEYGLNDQLSLFIREIERAGVLEVGEETVLFRHRSFLDYFAAFYIYDKRDEFDRLNDFIVNIYFNDAWGETAFFYVGLKREVNEKLLNSILDYDRDSLWVNLQKVMAGRLLQAGWHSPAKIKYNGIEKALGFIPSTRDKLYRIAQRGKWPEPKIIVDFLLVNASDYSFRSMFLAKELKELFDNIAERKQHTDLTALIFLLWVMRPFIPHEDFVEEVQKMLDLSEHEELEAEERVRATLLLLVMKGNDKSLAKAIGRRLRKLREQFPKEFKNLLPPDPTKQPKFDPPVKRRR